ncbi:MAG: sugar phosphate isomerase/epimerase family protein [Pirellulales bacterium]
MFVAASSECFPDLSYSDVLDRLVDLEYTALDLAIHETGGHLRPSEVHRDLPRAIDLCRSTRRITLAAFSVSIEAEGDEYFEQFASCCKLAKAVKVVTITVPSGELGTPFNAEIERLRDLVAIASLESVLVGVKTETGCITQDPDTVAVLCDNAKGLGITLDPSHYICGPNQGANFDRVMKYVYHVQLRDSTKDKLQVRVGQGEVEYGRLIAQLSKHGYDRTLSVHMPPLEGIDHQAEMRKMRLLLESLV